jgi:hypothetical protein
MLRFNFYYLFIIIFFLGCDSSPIEGGSSSTTTGGSGPSLISIDFGLVSDNSIEINLNTSHDIAGFQFGITGISILEDGASGGLAEENGFTVSTGTSIVLGFSLTGNVIPSGSNSVLTNLAYTNQISEICIVDVVLSDSDANSLNIDSIGDCIEY